MMRAVLAVAREQGGLAACEALPAGSWPALLAEYRVRGREAIEASEVKHGKNQSYRRRAP